MILLVRCATRIRFAGRKTCSLGYTLLNLRLTLQIHRFSCVETCAVFFTPHCGQSDSDLVRKQHVYDELISQQTQCQLPESDFIMFRMVLLFL